MSSQSLSFFLCPAQFPVMSLSLDRRVTTHSSCSYGACAQLLFLLSPVTEFVTAIRLAASLFIRFHWWSAVRQCRHVVSFGSGAFDRGGGWAFYIRRPADLLCYNRARRKGAITLSRSSVGAINHFNRLL